MCKCLHAKAVYGAFTICAINSGLEEGLWVVHKTQFIIGTQELASLDTWPSVLNWGSYLRVCQFSVIK